MGGRPPNKPIPADESLQMSGRNLIETVERIDKVNRKKDPIENDPDSPDQMDTQNDSPDNSPGARTREKIFGLDVPTESDITQKRSRGRRSTIGKRKPTREKPSRTQIDSTGSVIHVAGPQFDPDAPFDEYKPKVDLKKDGEGHLRPYLVGPNEVRDPFQKTDPVIDQALLDSTKNYKGVQQVSPNPEIMRYDSQNKNLKDLPSNLVRPESDIISAGNAYNNKWWFNAVPSYLEIIYEQNEGEDEPTIYENPNYDDPAKKKASRAELEKDFWNKHMKKELGFEDEWDADGDKSANRIPGQQSLEDIQAKRFRGAPHQGSLEDGTAGYNKASLEQIALQADFINGFDYPAGYQWDDGVNVHVPHQADGKEDGTNSTSNVELENDINNPNHELVTMDDKLEIGSSGRVVSINGQDTDDIAELKVRDKDGSILDLNKQRAIDVKKGILKDNSGHRFFSNFLSTGDIKKGLLRTNDGRPVLIRDQSFAEIHKEGILRDSDGTVVEIRGQKAEDVNKGIIKLENGKTQIKLDDQREDLLKRGIMIDSEGNKIMVSIPQSIDDLRKGVMRDKHGLPHRAIDQKVEDLQKGDPFA